ncbi:MAG TPA: trypsin-like serine protease [Pseudonocardiaceae bacterium]|nr:trypsin-like serine protease [Pseudonocardiaceae bacterium]
MNKLMTAAVVGGAVLAVGVLPAAGLASAAVTPPTPIPVPVSPTATATPTPAPTPTHHKTRHRKPTTGHHKTKRKGHSKKRHRTSVVHDPVVHQPVHRPVVHPPIATPTPAPTPTPQSSPRIIGGQNAGDAPWAAQVSWNDTGFACSGTVIAPQWVLTAGHCANSDGMSVLIGSPQLGQGTADKVDNATVDPNGDLALLHLADPVQTTFAALADQDPKAGDINEIYGWGMTSTNSGPAQQLKMAKVKVTSVSCQDAVGGKAICSSAITGAAFHGDSGGPEMANGVEVGVCSTGDEQDRTQEYASVAANRDWIRQVANV